MTAITNGVAPGHAHAEWRSFAACLDEDPDTFYPESTRTAAATPAKRVCVACPVRRDCLTWALDTDQEHGVWGGLTEKERARLTRVLDDGDVARAWELADELVEPRTDHAAMQIAEIVARYQAGESPADLATDYRVHATTILKWIRAEGVQTRPQQPRQATCMRGHPLDAENSYCNGTHADGTQRLSCRRCHLARQTRQCVACDRDLTPGEPAECASCAEQRKARRA